MQQITEMWVLSSAVVVLATILGFAAKLIATQVIKRLDDIIIELQSLTKVTTAQEERIRTLHDNSMIYASTLSDFTLQLNDHSHRLMKLEITLDSQSHHN